MKIKPLPSAPPFSNNFRQKRKEKDVSFHKGEKLNLEHKLKGVLFCSLTLQYALKIKIAPHGLSMGQEVK